MQVITSTEYATVSDPLLVSTHSVHHIMHQSHHINHELRARSSSLVASASRAPSHTWACHHDGIFRDQFISRLFFPWKGAIPVSTSLHQWFWPSTILLLSIIYKIPDDSNIKLKIRYLWLTNRPLAGAKNLIFAGNSNQKINWLMKMSWQEYKIVEHSWCWVPGVSHLRNRKHVPCFYRVIQTRVEVWENEKCCGNTNRRRVFPQLFRVLPNFHECLYNPIETRSTCFLFLLENNATRKRKTTC